MTENSSYDNMRKGFTLVELSIVLVIIGLLIGGILVARSMIETAKIQRLIRDITQYEISINNFKMNYKYYPGDNSYFTPPGNADNKYSNTGPACAGVYSGSEARHAFAHLSEAKMIATNYVPYTPIQCGGSMDNDIFKQNGIMPYTELDSKAAAANLGRARYPIFMNGLEPLTFPNPMLEIYVNASYVIPMETKLGVKPNTVGALGLVNATGYYGVCPNVANNATVACSAEDAAFGRFYYNVAPL